VEGRQANQASPIQIYLSDFLSFLFKMLLLSPKKWCALSVLAFGLRLPTA